MDSLAKAIEAGKQGRLEAWVHDFLLEDEPKNQGLHVGLKKAPRWWLGPVEVALADMPRIVGPESHMEYPVDEAGWKKKTQSMAADIKDGWRPAPLIAEWRPTGLSLRDGNHRREALEAAGLKRYWTVIWFNSEEDLKKYKN